MKPVVLSDVLAVGEFPTSEQVAILAKAGFKSLLNNQPDGEVARFETSSGIAAEAARYGLAQAYVPLSSRTPPADELARYAKAVVSLPAPIYAFCYSGSRAASGCALMLTASMEVDAIINQFGEAGYDIAALRPWLEDERSRHVAAIPKAGNAVTAPAIAEAIVVKPANGQDAKPQAAQAAAVAAPAIPPVAAERAPEHAAAGLPKMIVVLPRAAGHGGFAM